MRMKRIKKWHLSRILKKINIAEVKNGDIIISDICCDSREVTRDCLFVALQGCNQDGNKYIKSAIEKGARAIICNMDAKIENENELCVIRTIDPKETLAQIASVYYKSKPRKIGCVTGTNGKTSVAHFAKEIWQYTGHKSAYIGTIGIYDNDGKVDYDRNNFLTTPDNIKLHKILEFLRETKDIEHLAMEASSHGLEQRRLIGIKPYAAAFTNLTHDHLDYHGNFDNYFAAKMRLFNEILPSDGYAILNADCPYFDRISAICHTRGQKIFSYGYNATSGNLKLIKIEKDGLKQNVQVEFCNRHFSFCINLIGEFQVYNILAAILLVNKSHIAINYIIDVLPYIKPVPGRMQQIGNHPIFVDYAHTPDALEKVLTVMRPYSKGQLIVVFGCGGDRDKTKRPKMGKIANDLADVVFVTDDNPRSEDSSQIRREIIAYCPKAIEIANRKDAIHTAIKSMNNNDILLIAGKGHEKIQIYKDRNEEFDDVKIAEAICNKKTVATISN